MEYYSDSMRHLVCKPYSIENLHKMAEDLNIKRCWFHKNHYDIPKRRVGEIAAKTKVVSPKEIWMIINGRVVELVDTADDFFGMSPYLLIWEKKNSLGCVKNLKLWLRQQLV